jgi:hypothetical protein
MDFGPSEEQRLLQETIRALAAEVIGEPGERSVKHQLANAVTELEPSRGRLGTSEVHRERSAALAGW